MARSRCATIVPHARRQQAPGRGHHRRRHRWPDPPALRPAGRAERLPAGTGKRRGRSVARTAGLARHPDLPGGLDRGRPAHRRPHAGPGAGQHRVVGQPLWAERQHPLELPCPKGAPRRTALGAEHARGPPASAPLGGRHRRSQPPLDTARDAARRLGDGAALQRTAQARRTARHPSAGGGWQRLGAGPAGPVPAARGRTHHLGAPRPALVHAHQPTQGGGRQRAAGGTHAGPGRARGTAKRVGTSQPLGTLPKVGHRRIDPAASTGPAHRPDLSRPRRHAGRLGPDPPSPRRSGGPGRRAGAAVRRQRRGRGRGAVGHRLPHRLELLRQPKPGGGDQRERTGQALCLHLSQPGRA